MGNLRKSTYFTKGELLLWFISVFAISLSFVCFDRENYLTLTASLIGVTSLIFCAKGNPFGQLLMVVFSLLYGVISFKFSYYGEMLTYLGMTGPMAVFALISWLRNPYNGSRAQVEVNRLNRREIVVMLAASAIVTGCFYLILRAFDTANLIPSTLSVTPCLPDIPQKCLLCYRLCRQRYGSGLPVAFGLPKRDVLFVRRYLFSCILGE